MDKGTSHGKIKGNLRRRILTAVAAVTLLSLLGSAFSLYRMNSVNRSLDQINHVAIPLSRLLGQLQADGEVFHRELDRRLGFNNWKDPHWRARPLPRWISDVLFDETDKLRTLLGDGAAWSSIESYGQWQEWSQKVSTQLGDLIREAGTLHQALSSGDWSAAQKIYPTWVALMESWNRELQWGSGEAEKMLRGTMSSAQSKVGDLRTGLQMILIVVVTLSLLLLWLSERALRPLRELTLLARRITQRGLNREDKFQLPEMSMIRQDEVSQLSREFRQMATALLEREKMVETQKLHLEHQNQLLREMGALNKNVLNSIESALLVADLNGVVTQCNPIAARFLNAAPGEVIASQILDWQELDRLLGDHWKASISNLQEKGEWIRLPSKLEGNRVLESNLMPLRQQDGKVTGVIIVIEDLTEKTELERRLRLAENLAAVGRMSAQVAHEVRNPLHSIGLEAEMGLDWVTQQHIPEAKQSLQSILISVERLQKITENYLKLSTLSVGKRSHVHLEEVFQNVLAIYASQCERQRVTVDWRKEKGAVLIVHIDMPLIEQVMGNLMKNALQAMEAQDRHTDPRRINWSFGNTESGRIWARIEDNGPGVNPELEPHLFSPFFTTKAEGTGLGLSYIRQVMMDHGGDVRYVKSHPMGAAFELIFPAAMTSVEAPSEEVPCGSDLSR